MALDPIGGVVSGPNARTSTDLLRGVDERVLNFFRRIDSSDPSDPTAGPYTDIPYGEQGSQGLNPKLYARQLVNIGRNLKANGLSQALSSNPSVQTIVGGTKFALEQAILFALNRNGRVWNPLLADPPPIIREAILPALDLIPHADAVAAPGGDRHAELAAGTYTVAVTFPGSQPVKTEINVGSVGLHNVANFAQPRYIGAPSQDDSLVQDPLRTPTGRPEPIVSVALKLRNTYGPDHGAYGAASGDEGTSSDGLGQFVAGAVVTNAELTDAALQRAGLDSTPSPASNLLQTRDVQGGGVARAFFAPVDKLFKPTMTRMGRENFPVAGLARRPVVKGDLEVAAFPGGIIPASFPKERSEGCHEIDVGGGVNGLPTDDEAYVPLSFEDVRPYGNKLRVVYFRPFIVSFGEQLQPEWNQQMYFGRVDPVKTYGGTVRTFTLVFRQAAFSPEDVAVIWRKINWLSSMVYPEYDRDMLFKSGPVVRLRVGDFFKVGGNRGVPGTIDSINFDYTDAIWELKKNWKVPRHITISVNFTTLHEVPIGRGDAGKFGGLGAVGSDGKYVPPGAGVEDQRSPLVNSVTSFRGFTGGEIDDYAHDNARITPLKNEVDLSSVDAEDDGVA